MSGCSLWFNDNLGDTLCAMYTRVESVKNFSMARSKSIYNVNHGLAPYLKILLQTILEKADTFSFDESLNKVIQTFEIDLFVRFWDGTDKCIKVRYYGSMFLGHGRHTEILHHFVGMAKDLKFECLYQSSVDGITVNVKFFQEFSAKFKNANYHSLTDIDSCPFHTVNGAFQTNAKKSGWALKILHKGVYMILHNTPGRREDHESVTGSSTYPHSFS